MEGTIEHNPQDNCFLLPLEGFEARLEYRRSGDKINFTSTYVPPELRGRGVAEKLVRAGLQWARAQGLQIQASCWYVQKFL
ncbi:GNAT family N-acetyltransferase [Shewanella cyperi]|uniref:N-acetyltransferase n=1 Tax=Shewanella cyperi TaxID=2814292 RepID=A0A974XMU2_9GAMM|nr:GNAT family N-acetyltransferase [Shewanella cyperi]QSX30163.1 N-acetyltransferase [Shewanella cyperi]QSX40937.1 N-acetyltransferase [Shewanella cyperi]